MSRKVKAYKSNYLIKQLSSATAFFNKKLQLMHASDKWLNDFEFNLNTVYGKSIHELFQNANKKWQDNVQQCLLGQVNDSFIEPDWKTGNDAKWIEWNMIPWYNEKEDIVGIIIQTNDATNFLQKNQELLKLQTLLKEKSEITKIGSWNINLITNQVTWCDMTRNIHEVPMDYVPDVETGIEFYKQGHNRNTISRLVENAIKHGTEWKEKLQIVTGKNNEKWVIAAGKPLYENDKIVSIFGTFQDIDDQVQRDIKIKESEELLQTIMDNIPISVYIKDLDSKKLFVNKAEWLNQGLSTPDSLLGKDDFDLFPKNIAERNRNEDLMVLNSGIPMIGRESICSNNGVKTTKLKSKIPLVGRNGAVTGLVGISMDISDLKQKEEELKTLIEVTTEQNSKLINFAHIVSHNLRSHSANFSMLLSLLENETQAEERKTILTMLVTASDNLLETLENLNEVVSINTNTNLVKKREILRERITKVSENLSAFLQNNNAKIINRVSDKITVKVIPAYLDSILMNFITNGIKYKEPSRDPVIEIWVIKNKKSTVLSIKDNGLGIDLDSHGDKLFGMYKTFHDNPDARGIGLYIAKNQIEAMNGRVTVTSEVGKGTIFNIIFNEND